MTKGRKKLPDDERKAERLHLRLNEETKRRYEKAAEKAGLPLSEWIRVVLDRNS